MQRRALSARLCTKKQSGGTFNITRGRGRTIIEAAEIVAGLVPQTVIRTEEADKRLPSRGELDVSLAKERIGFDPRVDLEEGLRRYHAYLLDQRKRGVW